MQQAGFYLNGASWEFPLYEGGQYYHHTHKRLTLHHMDAFNKQ